MAVKSIDDLFLHTLKDIYSAEKQILKQLPKMAKVVKSADLKHAFESDREETEHQLERLGRQARPAAGEQASARDA